MDYKWKYYPSDKMSERAQMELSPYKTNFPFKWGQDRYYETKFANVMGHTYPFSELIRV